MRVLIVDDSELTRNDIEYSIQKQPGTDEWKITKAGSFGEALNALGTQIFDVALLDINLGMGNKDAGIRLLEHIRKPHEHTVAIMMTSVDDGETITRCLEKAADYIIKPFDEENTLRIITVAQHVHRLIKQNQKVELFDMERKWLLAMHLPLRTSNCDHPKDAFPILSYSLFPHALFPLPLP